MKLLKKAFIWCFNTQSKYYDEMFKGNTNISWCI